jgi:hypothetical protein
MGPYLAAVTSRVTGLASTYRELRWHHEDRQRGVTHAGSLLGREAQEVAHLALSLDTVEAGLGMAALNSLLPPNDQPVTEQSALELLAPRVHGKNVAVVGAFHFAERLREVAKELWVVERDPSRGDITDSEADVILSGCDVVCITGSTLLNRSLEGILRWARGSYVALVGPTVPMSPVLFDFGVDALCGSVVTDPGQVMRSIGQGASFHEARLAGIRRVTLLKP